MRTFLHVIRDLWRSVWHDVPSHDTEMHTLRANEQDARRAAQASRRRQQRLNVVEAIYLGRGRDHE